MKQKIIFFGSGLFVIPVVERLLDHGLELVVTNESSGKLTDFCQEKNIPFASSQLQDGETIERLKNIKPDVAILASYGAFIPNEVINLFENGIINIHPSLLPLWKGPSPVQFSLLSGATQTGVTLIKLDNEIDHGPILSQKPYNLTGDETTEDLLSILFEIGAEMVEEEIIKLENEESLDEIAQDHNKETWSYKITKEDGKIDLSSPELETENWKLKIDHMIRAYYPWPGVWFTTQLKGQTKIVKLLPENRIQVEGKNPMSYKDFINGFENEGREILDKLNLA